MLTLERNPVAADKEEQPQIDKIESVFEYLEDSNNHTKLMLKSSQGTIELPDSVFNLLRQLVYYLGKGQAVSIVPVNKEMTTQEAADILNVSRPYLVSLLERGEIPFRKVGTHRRIRFDELMEYKKKRDSERRKLLTELSQLSQEAELHNS
jgi:excisionase family DNA binding protein